MCPKLLYTFYEVGEFLWTMVGPALPKVLL